MPQKDITEATEWSASKVSRLLSKMDEEGLVRKITLGRENVIQLVGDDREDGDREAVADE
jgi:uncharacterized membrane protein